MTILRSALLGVSRSQAIKKAITTAPVTKGVVDRYIAGDQASDAIAASSRLVGAGLAVTIDHLGEDTLDRAQAGAVADAYVQLLGALRAAGLAGSCEVSVKLTALGLALGADGRKIAVENALRIGEAARSVGTTMTVDMEDHTTTDATLAIVAELRQDFPDTGAVLQAYLHRTEGDCRDLAHDGSRIRLCKGAYAEPESVAYRNAARDRPVVRTLPADPDRRARAIPMIATHDPTLIEIARAMLGSATLARRAASSSRCSTASARPSSSGWSMPGTPCGSTCRTAPSGTATSCAAWPSGPRTSPSSLVVS